MTARPIGKSAADTMELETLHVRQDGAVLFADIAAPPMNLLGIELVRDLVSLSSGRRLTLRFKCWCSRAQTRTTSSRTST